MQITVTIKGVHGMFVAKEMNLLCLYPLLYMFSICLPLYQLSVLMKK